MNTKPGVWQLLYARLGRRLHRSLWQSLKKPGALQRRLTLSLVVAIVFSLTILMTTALLFGLGLLTLFASDLAWPARILIGAPLVGLGWLGRPRWSKLPTGCQQAGDFPALNRLMRRIAEALRLEPPRFVIIDSAFNASIGRFGWTGTSLLTLGLPLTAALEPQELVALLGHELGHLAAGDPQRHWLIGSTVNILASWHDALHPGILWVDRPTFFEQLYTFLANLLLLGLATLVRPPLWVLSLLLWRESQRAEYRADQIAAGLAGRRAMASLFRKLGRAGQVEDVVQARALSSRQRPGARDLITRIHELDWRVSNGPPTDAEAGHVVDRDLQADASHPPRSYRLDLLFTHSSDAATLTLSQGEFEAIRSELQTRAADVEARLIDGYLSRI